MITFNPFNKKIYDILNDTKHTTEYNIRKIEQVFIEHKYPRVHHIVIAYSYPHARDMNVMIYLCNKQPDLYKALYWNNRNLFLKHIIPYSNIKCALPYCIYMMMKSSKEYNNVEYIKSFESLVDYDELYKYVLQLDNIMCYSSVPIHMFFANNKVDLDKYIPNMISACIYSNGHACMNIFEHIPVTLNEQHKEILTEYGYNVNEYNELTIAIYNYFKYDDSCGNLTNIYNDEKYINQVPHHFIINFFTEYVKTTNVISFCERYNMKIAYSNILLYLYKKSKNNDKYINVYNIFINCRTQEDFEQAKYLCAELSNSLLEYLLNNHEFVEFNENNKMLYIPKHNYYKITSSNKQVDAPESDKALLMIDYNYHLECYDNVNSCFDDDIYDINVYLNYLSDKYN